MPLSQPAVDIITGATLAFSDSDANSFMAEIYDATIDVERNVPDVSHFGSTQPSQTSSPQFGGREWLAGRLDGVTLNASVHYNPDFPPPCALGTAGTLTLTFYNHGTTATIIKWDATTPVGSAVCESVSIGLPLEDKMTADCVFKLSGVGVVTEST